MKIKSFRFNVSVITSAIAILSATPVNAHELYTKSGYWVDHVHNTTLCLDKSIATSSGICLSNNDDTTMEASYGFSSSERNYRHTGAWNCHGRTFANRKAWVNLADAWIAHDGPMTPTNPQIGDVVVWLKWVNDGYTTAHTVTIVGPWNGNATLVKSKYGALGEYTHALSKSIAVYSNNGFFSAVTRFGAGTVIYKNIADGNNSKHRFNNIVSNLLEQSKSMPWYKELNTLSEETLADQKKAIIASGELDEQSKNEINQSGVSKEKTIDSLMRDFISRKHYSILFAYNSPAFSTDHIAAIQAGQELVKLAKNNGQKNAVIEKFEKLIFSKQNVYVKNNEGPFDMLRGGALFFMKQILSKQEFDDLKVRLFQFTQKNGKQEFSQGMPEYYGEYTNYYLENK